MWGKPRREEAPKPEKPFVFALGETTIEPIVEPAPIPHLVQAIIQQGVRENAVAIQLLPIQSGLRVEYLRDETWGATMTIPSDLEPAIVTHLKEMAGLPTQYRMALDGLILFRFGAQDYDIAISVRPTRQGEKITLHITLSGDSLE